MDKIIDDFNDVLMTFIKELKKICPHSLITNNADVVEGIINSASTKKMPIEQFVLNVLEYKNQIDEYNESFFLSREFKMKADLTIKDSKYIKTSGFMNILGDVESIWTTLSDDNKKNIFDYMQVLCYYAQEFFLMVTNRKIEFFLLLSNRKYR